MKKLLFILSIGFVLFACSRSTGTKISSSWHDGDSNYNAASFNKIAVIVMDKNEGERRQAEDKFASLFGAKGVPAYTISTGDVSSMSDEQISSELQQANCDAAMIVRLSDVENTQGKRTPRLGLSPNLYTNFHGHWGGGIGVNVYSGYSGGGKDYEVESMIYELPKGDLVWSTVTSTRNPDGFSDLLSQVVRKVDDQLEDDNLK